MKRRHVILILVSLVWGVLCTFGVAWFFAATSEAVVAPVKYTPTHFRVDPWNTRFLDRHPDFNGMADILVWPEMRGFQTRWYVPVSAAPTDPTMVARTTKVPRITTTLCGWPWLALEVEELYFKPQPDVGPEKPFATYSDFVLEGGFFVPIPKKDSNEPLRPLPCRPVWPGFYADTAAYSLTLLVPVLLLKFVRWCLSARAGCCPRCKYPFGSSPMCTECGNRLTA